MPADLDLTVPATTRGLDAALQSLEEVCAALSVDDGLLWRARIVVEELFTNIMKYGYGGECDRPVRVGVEVAVGLTVTLEDEAFAFDPTQWKPASASPERVGQAGIALVSGLSSQMVYQRLANGNRITVVIVRRML